MAARPLGVGSLAAILGAWALACSSSTEAPAGGPSGDPTCQGGEGKTYILTSLAFTRESPKGVAPGFDLDGKVSAEPDPASCGKTDMKAPDGAPGVDNQLAALVPDIEKLVGNAIDGIIQGAINDGRLLIALDLAGVNDLRDDRCVDLEVKLAQGKPSLGTDGVVEAFQTFDPKREGQLLSPAKGGRIAGGTFSIGPFPLRIPIAIFDVSFTIFVRDALVRFTIKEDGDVEGLLGGGISIEEVAEGVKNGAGVADLIPQIKLVGRVSADLGYDPAQGTCSLVSAALAFKARPAFIRK